MFFPWWPIFAEIHPHLFLLASQSQLVSMALALFGEAATLLAKIAKGVYLFLFVHSSLVLACGGYFFVCGYVELA